MKKLFIFAIPLLTALSSCAQDVSQALVPSVVLNAFQQKFPQASDVEWEKKGELYEVEFDLQYKDHKALLDSTGKIIKHKQEIKPSELPISVQTTLQKGFSKYKIDDVKRIETEGIVIYKVEVENAKEEKKVYLDANGKIIEGKTSYE